MFVPNTCVAATVDADTALPLVNDADTLNVEAIDIDAFCALEPDLAWNDKNCGDEPDGTFTFCGTSPVHASKIPVLPVAPSAPLTKELEPL